MILSGYISVTKPVITLASLSSNSPNSSAPNNPSRIPPLKRNSPQIKQQLSLAEVERAIGAGIYRDYDPASETSEKKGVMDVVLSNTIGKTEGPMERKLRETGEWLSSETKKTGRSSGKKILKIMYLWIVPIWFLLLFIATGAVKLPPSLSALNDLIM